MLFLLTRITYSPAVTLSRFYLPIHKAKRYHSPGGKPECYSGHVLWKLKKGMILAVTSMDHWWKLKNSMILAVTSTDHLWKEHGSYVETEKGHDFGCGEYGALMETVSMLVHIVCPRMRIVLDHCLVPLVGSSQYECMRPGRQQACIQGAYTDIDRNLHKVPNSVRTQSRHAIPYGVASLS